MYVLWWSIRSGEYIQNWTDIAFIWPLFFYWEAIRVCCPPLYGATRRYYCRPKLILIVKDDTGAPEVTKRIAQELVVNDKVKVLAGFGLTPLAMSTAPVATQSKTPMVVMAAATSTVTEASPYIVRTSFTVPQVVVTLADWASKNNIKKVVSLVTDYGPGIDSEKYFTQRFSANGGQVIETLRVPLRNPDFAPFLQRVRDAKPDALFTFVPAGVGSALMKQYAERGLIRLEFVLLRRVV